METLHNRSSFLTNDRFVAEEKQVIKLPQHFSAAKSKNATDFPETPVIVEVWKERGKGQNYRFQQPPEDQMREFKRGSLFIPLTAALPGTELKIQWAENLCICALPA